MMAGASGRAPSAVSAVWLTGAGADQALATELGRVLGDGATGRRGDGETGRRGDGESDDVNTDRGLAFDFAGSPPPPVAPSPRRPVPPGRPVRVALLPRGRLPGGGALSPSLDTALGLALLGLRPAAERLDLARALRTDTERRAAGPARRLPVLVGAGAAAVGVALLLLFGPGAGDRDLAAAASRAQADARRLAS